MKATHGCKWEEITRSELGKNEQAWHLPVGGYRDLNRTLTSSDEARSLSDYWTGVYMCMNGMVMPKPKNAKERAAIRVKTRQLTNAIVKSLRAISAPEIKVSSAVCAGVQESIEGCINTYDRDRVGMARALRAGVDLVASLRKVNPVYGNYLLQLMRTWNGLGPVEDPKLDEAREIALLKYVGVDEGYITKYEELRSWALKHLNDADSGWQFYRVAIPLMQAFVGDRRIDEAARVCRDIYDIACLNDDRKISETNEAVKSEPVKGFRRVVFEEVVPAKLSKANADRTLYNLLRLTRKEIEAGHIDLEAALQLPAVLCGEVAREEVRKQRPLIIEYLRVATILTYVARYDFKAVETLMKEAVEPQPLPLPMQVDFGWRIDGFLKAHAATIRDSKVSKEAYRRRSAAKILCNLYLQLGGLEKPSPLHSLLLRRACGLLGEQDLIEFIVAWDLNQLREEDYEPWRPQENKRVDSLVEVLIPAIYRALKRMLIVLSQWKALGKENPEAEARYKELRKACLQSLEFVGANYQRYPEKPIFHYYYARMLTWTSRREKAREELLSNAARYSSAWWFWSALADTYEGGSMDRFCLLCRSILTCPQGESEYLQRVLPTAQYEAGKLGIEWSSECVEKYAGEADRQLQARNSAIDGVLLSVEPSGDLILLRALIADKDSIKGVQGLVANLSAKGWVRGQPVRVSLGGSNKDTAILSAEARDGDRWDILPWLDGVVIGSRPARGVWIVRMADNDEIQVSARHWRQAEQWNVGMPVKLKLVSESKLRLVVAEEAADKLPEFARLIEGAVLRVDAHGNALVNSDVRIPRRLALPLGLRPGANIKTTAIADRRKDNCWEAILASVIN